MLDIIFLLIFIDPHVDVHTADTNTNCFNYIIKLVNCKSPAATPRITLICRAT